MVDLVSPSQLSVDYKSKVFESLNPFKHGVVEVIVYNWYSFLVGDAHDLAFGHIELELPCIRPFS